MKTLKSLKNIQKAKLLHDLFTDEIPQFLEFLKQECETIEKEAEQIRAAWKQEFFSADLWISLSAQTLAAVRKNKTDFQKSSYLFSERLFDGFGTAFLAHKLNRYCETQCFSEPKFDVAVDLFFNP